jgi:hypothetical protein
MARSAGKRDHQEKLEARKHFGFLAINGRSNYLASFWSGERNECLHL